MGLPASTAELEQMTPYSMAVTLYEHYSSDADIVGAICDLAHIGIDDERGDLVGFFIKTIMYRFNVQLTPLYRPLFVLDS